jgi:uncharacterized membrane protein
VRWLALAAGAALVGIAFLAGSRVEDTREGLIAEVVALLAGLAGVSLVMYGWVAANIRSHAAPAPQVKSSPAPRIRTANELVVGSTGLLIAVFLVVGIGVSAGIPWAALGLVLLLPMVIGCAYLCLRFLRAPERDWRIDLKQLRHLW